MQSFAAELSLTRRLKRWSDNNSEVRRQTWNDGNRRMSGASTNCATISNSSLDRTNLMSFTTGS